MIYFVISVDIGIFELGTMNIDGLVCQLSQLTKLKCFQLYVISEKIIVCGIFHGGKSVQSFYIYVHANKNQLVKKAMAIE